MSASSHKHITQNYNSKSSLMGSMIIINDLRDKVYAVQKLTIEEKTALQNFDKYRLAQILKQKSERNFHNKYIQLQVLANLCSYQDFLKEDYLSLVPIKLLRKAEFRRLDHLLL